MEKKDIIAGIHTLVSNNVVGNNAAASRYKGFRGELFFEDYLSSKYPTAYKQMEGGMIISKDSKESSLNNSLYLSIIPKEEYDENYLKIFAILSKINFQKMYLVLYADSWSIQPVMNYESGDISMNVPKMEIYEFDAKTFSFKSTSNNVKEVTDFLNTAKRRNKNTFPIEESTENWLFDNLEQFSVPQLTKIYMNRLFLDGYIGLGKEKGKPSDIDMIIKTPSNEYRLIEIKEKDLPKHSKKGFGLDVPRLEDLLRISNETKLEYHLVVRQINNQYERKLLGWKTISIDKFANDVKDELTVIGGTGMRSSASINETLICSYDLFRDL